ncbi:hypothetical protein N7509_004341 [Penicillium cosmopolitanum]|uniref:Zn(2)-C6 fungal-type domain-containing protein n=1 Tax=Penicillium cosmopolitanum TaxID=1131564 RepID=A0A9X0BC78_9EURO|nr:uncharacterized protein N7509_004341 [Penicillium cosmopolitanum]KAJ5404470.1 hypothetical protein N7509_004341 [Penicillium cosmopolitanum]
MSSATPAEDPSARRKRPARKYTSRACEECRRRRAKCDGNRPSCSRCLDRGIRCQYSTAEDGRQPAPKAYVVMLRNRIELLERVLHSHGIDPEASVAQLMAEDELSNQHQPTESEWASAGSNCNVEDLCGTFDGALTLDESLNFDQDGEVRYFGPTSGRLLFRSSENDSPVEEAYSTDPSCTGCSTNTPECPEPAATCRYEVAGELSPPYETWLSDELQAHLIDLYFEWEQPWFQMLNETLFRESMANGGRYFSPLLLTCILAVGSRYCDRLEVRTEPNDPNTAGRMFICKAEKLIQNDLRWPKITTIQSLAIMGMFYIATGSDAAGWLHQGMANRLALDMGFNMDPAVLAGLRQIYWALYCHDKLSASYAGRVCTLLDSQGVVNKPYLQCASTKVLPSAKGNGQLRAYSQRDVAKLHQAMIDLCRILEKILHSLWSPRPLLHAHQRSAFFDSCVLELKTWYYDLPSEIKIDRSSGPSKFPHAYTMLMVYHTIFILLCGPFMNKPSSSSNANTQTDNMTSTNQGESQEEKPSPDHSRTTKALASCSSSIRAMCLIIQKYRHTFGSFKMSPITATYCTLSAALIIIENCCTIENKSPNTTKTNPNPNSNSNANSSPDACTAEEATGSNRNLSPHVAVGLCMQVLRELSTSWNIAKRIGRNLEKVYTQRFGSDHVPCPPKECDMAAYEAATQLVDANIPFETNVPPLDTFDPFFDNKNAMHLQNPLSFHLEHQHQHQPLPSATEAHSIYLNQDENTPPVTGFDAGVGVGVGVNGPDFSNLVSSDELFAQNLGFAFEPDCLPSDYNMFDTLNQMYLEETW